MRVGLVLAMTAITSKSLNDAGRQRVGIKQLIKMNTDEPLFEVSIVGNMLPEETSYMGLA